jgi:hypothetical protein
MPAFIGITVENYYYSCLERPDRAGALLYHEKPAKMVKIRGGVTGGESRRRFICQGFSGNRCGRRP